MGVGFPRKTVSVVTSSSGCFGGSLGSSTVLVFLIELLFI